MCLEILDMFVVWVIELGLLFNLLESWKLFSKLVIGLFKLLGLQRTLSVSDQGLKFKFKF